MMSTKLTKKQIAAEKKLKIIRKQKEERINRKLTGEINSPFLPINNKPSKRIKKSETQLKGAKKKLQIKGILKDKNTSALSVEKNKRKFVEIATKDAAVLKKQKKVHNSFEEIKTDEVVSATKKNESDNVQNYSTSKKKIQKNIQEKKEAVSIQKDATSVEAVGVLRKSPKGKNTSMTKFNSIKMGTASNKNQMELISLCGRKRTKGSRPDSSNENVGSKSLKRKQLGKAQPPPSRGVCYFSHLPHGFYEKELRAYCSQFGKVTGVYHPVSKRGNSKGFAFVEFEHKEVAEVVADTMNNYLMFNRLLKCEYVPPERQKAWVFKRTSNLKEVANINREEAINTRIKDKDGKQIKNKFTRIKYLQKRIPYEFQVHCGSVLKKEPPAKES